jgi:hypothetical protein
MIYAYQESSDINLYPDYKLMILFPVCRWNIKVKGRHFVSEKGSVIKLK